MKPQLAQRQNVTIWGRTVSYLSAGPADGPSILLLHGLASDARTWEPLMTELARRGALVIAPDLLGHGDSDKPPLTYDLEAFARSVSALVQTLGLGHVTVAGHSLGGAIAMHLARGFPQACERLVLISSGGLGHRVHPVLRAATVPGTEGVLALLINDRTAPVYRARALHKLLRLRPETVVNLSRVGSNIGSRERRSVFFESLRGAIAPHGQRGSMVELGYLNPDRPTLVIWSENDPIVPVEHALAVLDGVPSAQVEILPGGSHDPHRRHAVRVGRLIADFVPLPAAGDLPGAGDLPAADGPVGPVN